jgi:hypothetical protein
MTILIIKQETTGQVMEKNSKPIPVGSYYFIVEYDGTEGVRNNLTGPITIIR